MMSHTPGDRCDRFRTRRGTKCTDHIGQAQITSVKQGAGGVREDRACVGCWHAHFGR
jgi:hypothetical protein